MKWIWVTACLLIFAYLFYVFNEFFVFFWAAAAPFAVSLAVRRKVSRMMLAKSDVPSANALAELESPEVLATTKPRLLVSYDSAPTQELIAIRQSLIALARRLFWRTFSRDLIAAAGYFILSVLTIRIFHSSMEDSSYELLIAFTIFASLLLRLFFHRNQLVPKNADFDGGESDLLFIILLREISRPRNLLPIVGIVAVISVAGLLPQAWPAALALLLALAFHALIVAHRAPKTGYNVRLLILRVFGIKKNATFTFGRLVQYWEQLGSYYTVVDPSFLSHQYRLLSPRIIIFFSLSLLWSHVLNSAIQRMVNVSETVSALIAAAVTLLVLIRAEYIRINRAFIKSDADLQTRLHRLEQNPRRQSDLSFQGMPTMCYDNTWKAAVSAFANASDVVLMDLRGFSEERKGCVYEVDFLFDTVPVDRVVFLVDGQTDAKLIRQFILNRWEYLRPTSPNMEVEAPEIRVFLCTEQNERDVQGILDHLIAAAVSSGRAKTELGGALSEGITVK